MAYRLTDWILDLLTDGARTTEALAEVTCGGENTTEDLVLLLDALYDDGAIWYNPENRTWVKAVLDGVNPYPPYIDS